MEALITSIEESFPDMSWLVRSTDDGPDRERMGGAYFAHIHGLELDREHGVYLRSFQGVGDTPVVALQMAFDLARGVTA